MNWIKCSERTPPPYKTVVVTNGRTLAVGQFGGDGQWHHILPAEFYQPTHWMEVCLPAPHAESQAKGRLQDMLDSGKPPAAFIGMSRS